MIKSMTGYGKCSEVINGREISVELKSVNHRFFEFSSRIPRAYGFLDEKIKSFVQSKVARGKIEAYVSVVNRETSDFQISVNEAVAKGYVEALRTLCEPLELQDDLRLSTVSRFPDVFTVLKEETDEEALWLDIKSVAEKAIEAFVNMRTKEGESLKADILSRLVLIEDMVSKVNERSAERNEEYRQRLYSKIKEVVESL